MRTHAQIIQAAGGVSAIRKVLRESGFDLPDATVRSWPKRPDADGSIPEQYWATLERAEIATLVELAEAAEARAKRLAERNACDEAAA